MFILLDGKAYILDGDKYVGVEIYSDRIIETKETITNPEFSILYTLDELLIKFHSEPYKEKPIAEKKPKVAKNKK